MSILLNSDDPKLFFELDKQLQILLGAIFKEELLERIDRLARDSLQHNQQHSILNSNEQMQLPTSHAGKSTWLVRIAQMSRSTACKCGQTAGQKRST